MITDPKAKKFVEFYLSELLTHVKSMSEHRFSPLEYNLIKKVIVFITQSRDHLSQVEKLSSVSTLSAFHAFLQKIVEKVQQPDFKKSQMISVIETDSEKLSQILLQILKSRDTLALFETELAKIGIEISTETLRSEPIKLAERAAEKPAKTITPAKEKSSAKQPVKTKESPKPQILTASEFKKVDDMIGFLSRRGKRSAHHDDTTKETLAARSSTEPPATGGGKGEGVVSDMEDFFSEFRTEFTRLESALTQLRTNLGRTRYIVEVADSFGEFKRIGKIFELPRFSRSMHAMEKALIDVADNVDGKTTGLNTASFGIIQELAVLLKEIEVQKNFPLSTYLLNEIHACLENFAASSLKSNTDVMSDTHVSESVEEVGAELMQSSVDDDEEKSVSLDLSNVAEDDFRVFKDEVRYTFETVRSAVEKLKASGSDPDAIKDIQQSFRSLFTGSRLLRLTLLSGHFELILAQLKTCITSQNAIAPELLHLIEETVKNGAVLVQGEKITEAIWNKIKLRLEKFGTQKELPTGETPAEFTARPAKTAPTEKISEKKAGQPVSDSVLASNENWIHAFQPILESHPFVVKETKEEKSVELAKPDEMKSRDPQVPEREMSRAKVAEPLKVAKVKGILAEKEKTAEPDHVIIPTNLVELMAGGDVDLSDFELPSFVDKLNIEPLNISAPKNRSGKKKVTKKETILAAGNEKTKIPANEQTENAVEAPGAGRFSLEESNFDAVDLEILDIFNQEADGYFKILDKSLTKLENQITDETALKDIERVSHSLKSSSRMLGLAKVSGLAGVIELIAERCNEKELDMDADLRNIMRETVQSIMNLLERKPADVSGIIEFLLRLEEKLSAPNIFVGNIPGAPAAVSSGVFVAPYSAINKEAMPDASNPKVEPEKEKSLEKINQKIEVPAAKTESTENYFTKIGVDEEIVEIFKEESSTYFMLMANSLAALRDNPAHETAMRDIEKSAHSLRSSAKMLGFQKIGNVVKPIEDVAEHINEGALAVSAEIVELFTHALAALKKLGDGVDVDITDVVDQLMQVEKKDARGSTPKEEPGTPAAKPKRTKKRSKPQSDYFADIQFTTDPILKHVDKGAAELLEEMAHSATQ
ncbi:Hpt domain-containing protein [bacterium]|nr:Hpt domain-containing protein [bacterium]